MNTKRILSWAFLIIALGALVFFMYKYGGESGTTENSELTSLPDVRSSDMVQGSANAKVTLVEYADFQCPACSLYGPLINQLEQQEGGDKLKVVYRYFPLTSIHKNALLSSQAAAAANLQGKFWQMHDKLFENQNAWSESDDAANLFASYAQQLGMDVDKFKSDLTSDQVKQTVQDSLHEAERLKLDSTPTFFLNGQKIQNPRTLDEFKKAVDDAAK